MQIMLGQLQEYR